MNCRGCHSDNVESIIPLGKLPLANALLKQPKKQELYNLEVMLCKNCGLAQLKNIISPEKLFSDYVYFSSNSETMLSSVQTLCQSIIPKLSKNAFVVEIASNDGYLLKNYVKENITVLGVDPAQNIAEQANRNGIPTLCDFFNFNVSEKIKHEHGKTDIIHANNVMAHVPEINDFVRGIKNLLKEDGYAVIEVPYFLDLVQKLEFDTIYHEHVYYFSLKALKKIFAKYDLCIFDYEKLKIHGGSCRLFVGHNTTYQESFIVENAIEQEEKCGLYDIKTYTHFMQKIKNLGENLRVKLETLKKEKKKVAAYGASAKGTTLLNFFNISPDSISFVVDRSDVKKGLYTPGTCLPINKTEQLLEENIDVALLLSWNFKDEIILQQKEFIEKGGKFLCPLPEVKYV